MSERELFDLLNRHEVAQWRIRLARWIESTRMQSLIVGLIVVNSVVLGMETSPALIERWGFWLKAVDSFCLGVFAFELAVKLVAYGRHFWRSGWNVFDFFVVAIAFVPGAGPWSVLRVLRVLRVFRLLTMVPKLRRVVAAFIHAIPGLSSVMLVLGVFFYAMGVLATSLFGEAFPQWFGSLGSSLYSLFQIMTLESWSMGIVRPVMEVYPWAWAFFVPFIVIATFTILNLFIGIIVSTMQELSMLPEGGSNTDEVRKILERMEQDLATVRKHLDS